MKPNKKDINFEPFESNLQFMGVGNIAGVDEAGRGPLAGPVVAAAVIFPPNIRIPGITDSKKLSERQREKLFPLIHENAIAVGVGRVDERTIDEINILQATYRAMLEAVEDLDVDADHVLVDGRRNPCFDIPQTSIVGGDRRCFLIAAASIIAKVTRDREMIQYDELYPEYGFAKHKGYGTQQHRDAILKYGRCPIHRKSFAVKGLD